MKEKSGISNMISLVCQGQVWVNLFVYFLGHNDAWQKLMAVKRFVLKMRLQYFSISMCLLSTSPTFKTEWWKSTRRSHSVHGLHFMNLTHTFIVLAPLQSPLLYFPLLLPLHQSSHRVCNLWHTNINLAYRGCTHTLWSMIRAALSYSIFVFSQSKLYIATIRS